MMQIVIWMLCVYLLLKGKELQLIAAASDNDNREHNLSSARVWSALAYVSAIIFFVLSIGQGSQIPSASSFPNY